MIPMKISVLYHNRFAFYEISNFSYCYSCDDEIAYFLNITINEYRERLEKLNIVKCYNGDNETFLVNYINEDKLIDIFKNEFVKELTLLKLSN